MGAAMDYYCGVIMANKWKTIRMNIGPGRYNLIGSHPDVMKVMLKSGMHRRYTGGRGWLCDTFAFLQIPRWMRFMHH